MRLTERANKGNLLTPASSTGPRFFFLKEKRAGGGGWELSVHVTASERTEKAEKESTKKETHRAIIPVVASTRRLMRVALLSRYVSLFL